MLWAAVLRRAVFDYVLYKGCGSHKMEWQLAAQYIFEEDMEYDNGLSFEEVCELFGWDPGYLRRLSNKLQRSDIKKLEFNTYREDFCLPDDLAVAADRRERWKVARGSVPLFLPYHYVQEIREKLSLKPVTWSLLPQGLNPPMVRWQMAPV